MDIVGNFKNYLLTQKNSSSPITIKNYISDIRRFIEWYKNTFKTPFYADTLNHDVVSQYENYINSKNESSLPAASSAKRYISSLRKFSTFLVESKAIKINPFSENKINQNISDPFFFKEFKNFLYNEQASKLTIKNYLMDIKQFTGWLEQVMVSTRGTEANELLQTIDSYVLEQYKTRLFNEAKLSPISINRKLSSLRRYTAWLTDKGVLPVIPAQVEPKNQTEIEETDQETVRFKAELPLTALQGIAEEKNEDQPRKYSNFPPFRLIQKSNKLITLGFDLLLFNPIANLAEALHYSLWKNGSKTIFTPVTNILEAKSYIPKGVSVKTIIPKQSSILPPASANFTSNLNKIRNYGATLKNDTVHNFSKSLYAPLTISIEHMPWKNKLLYHIRFTRPEWYKKYHSFAFVHYLHIGVLIIVTVISAKLLYQTWYGEPNPNQSVLSAQDIAPPRTLSFQGRLLDNENNPITAETPLRFTLYNSPTASGSALLWEEEQDIKPDQNGNFSATLGENVRLNQDLFTNNPSLYVGITVGDNQELSPRQQIPTTDYSANSQSVEGLKPITDSPNAAQNVLLALDSSGNLTIGGNSTHTFQATGGQFNLSGQMLSLTTNPGSNGNIKIAPDGSGIIDLEKPLQNASNNIGPSGVSGAVEVDDILSVFANQSSQSALIVNQNGTGDIISGSSHGNDKFKLDNNGNEYIGGNLVLDGDTIGTNSTVFDIAGSNVNNLSIGDNAKVITLGGSSGVTSIENSLSVQGATTLLGPINMQGPLTASAGITIPDGQKLTLSNFAGNGIPFLNGNSQVVEDASNFSWNDSNDLLNVTGSICIQNGSGVCGTTPGTIYATNTTVQSADLAENYVSSQTLSPGDVVVLEGQNNTNAVIKSTSPYQKGLIGIMSTNPGITLNSGAKTDSEHPNIYPLALQGRVPVNVSTINGPIEAGDDITSSSIPGVAMEASQSGQIIGKALEAYSNSDPNAVGQIMVFVNLSYQSFPTTLTDNGNLAAATQSASLQNTAAEETDTATLLQSLSDIANTISLGAVQARSMTTQSLQVATDNITIGGQTLKAYITSIVEQVLNQELNKRFAQLPHSVEIVSPIASNSAFTTNQSTSQEVKPTPIASPGGTLETSNNTTASSPSATIVYNIYNSIASPSAQASEAAIPSPTQTPIPTESLNEPDASNSGSDQTPDIPNDNTIFKDINNNQYEPVSSLSAQLTQVSNLQANFGTFTQGLIALGPTSLTDVSISNSLSINNNLKISSDSINTIGTDLNIEPLRQGDILFMGGLVAIDTQGNLKVNGNASFSHNVTVHGQLAAGIIAPIPNNDLTINLKNKSNKTGSSLVITNATGSAVLEINQSGDLASSGEASFNSVSSNGFSIIRGAQADTSMTETVSNGSAGTGVITAYETERTIVTPYVTSHSLIYITPTTDTQGITPYLARQTVEDPTTGTTGSFTVALPTTSTKDIGFNWWIVN